MPNIHNLYNCQQSIYKYKENTSEQEKMHLQFLAGFLHRNLEPVLLADTDRVHIEEWPIVVYA